MITPSKETIKKRIIDMHKETNKPPKRKDYAAKYGYHGLGQFKTWAKAVEFAGITPNQPNITNEDLREMLFDLIDELGQMPTFKVFNERYRKRGMINSRFGSWNNFCDWCEVTPIQRYYSNDDICSLEGCENPVHSKSLCLSHYNQNRRTGRATLRVSGEPGQIYEYDNYIYVETFNLQNEVNELIKIDKDKKNMVEGYNIEYSKDGNASIRLDGVHKTPLTHYLFGKPKQGQVYIFKNKNNRDLRRENVILTNISERSRRIKIPSNNKTGVKGVFYNEKIDLYVVNIGHEGKNIYLGSSKNFFQAVKMRLAAEKEYWGKVYQDIDLDSLKETRKED